MIALLRSFVEKFLNLICGALIWKISSHSIMFIFKTSSKTSMREILNEEEQAADGDDDGDSDASIDFPCDDMDKVLNYFRTTVMVSRI